MNVSTEGKKVVVFDTIGPHSRENMAFDRTIAPDKWYNYSTPDLYDACLAKGIQLITADVFFALEKKPKNAICVRERDDGDMSVALALKREGVRLAYMRSSENPFYACRFYWGLPGMTKHYDHSVLMKGIEPWVSKKSKFTPQYTPHGYYAYIREVKADFHKKKFLTQMQSNLRIHWARRLYVDIMNTVKPMPNFVNREGYRDRLEAIYYFAQFPDFDLYGRHWDQPVRYSHKYDEAIRKSYRGAPADKLATLQQYKFSLCFENSYLAGYVQYMKDALYAGSVPIYWGAPDIAEIFPENCFIDFRKFDCDYDKLNAYLRGMDEKTYNEYIENINKWIASPTGGYAISKEHYIKETVELFESYFK